MNKIAKAKYERLLETTLQQLHRKLAAERHEWMVSHRDNFMEYWEEFETLGSETINEISNIQNELSLLTPIELEEWDGNGNKMSIKEWVRGVKDGGFIDYDGYGYYSVDGKKSNKVVYPSGLGKFKIRDKEFTDIIWYNR